MYILPRSLRGNEYKILNKKIISFWQVIIEKIKMGTRLIYIADSQDLTREGTIQLVGKFFNGEAVFETMRYRDDLFTKLAKQPPFLLIIDLITFDLVCEIEEIKLLASETNILVISDSKDSEQIRQVLKLGINHYILKTSAEDELFSALKAILNNRKYLSCEVYELLIQKEKSTYTFDKSKIIKLSKCESEIARLISMGKTSKDIAEIRKLSIHTINTHRKNIFRKLGIKTTVDLVKYALNAGLTSDIEYYI